jgi:hypothetical protein
MIEVFKTNVRTRDHAEMLIRHIHHVFDYQASFDLQDCDNVLRVQCTNGIVKAYRLIQLLNDCGFDGEVMEDNLPVVADNGTSICDFNRK